MDDYRTQSTLKTTEKSTEKSSLTYNRVIYAEKMIYLVMICLLWKSV